jgi:hypothetical protein
MSAQLQQSNSFSAHLALAAGVAVSITAGTLDDLASVVGKLQAKQSANDTKAETKSAKTETKLAVQETPAGNASASTGTQASAQGAASGSEAAADAPRPTYDDVKARVLALAKIGRDKATAALAKFGVDHGNKLKLEDYPAFLKHADEVLGAAK